ncbi:NADPH-dependent ferric siderophore reductase [Luteibacter rhizovicinus]|uniref:NADPH-dependent ferric siderophore reductase n=1 Tax=Luteibacter rhizovicinus TaxID=242606 RepID=A0A4R3YWR7_9GAMM|nr:siderophore-interacting protein [Luteibacter rhizovicinus]TCV97587.1 NADPH-dependent ferric siderophore reductase [Luteibacter rhizovicinus]
MGEESVALHASTRVRHPIRMRRLTVKRVKRLTPHMLRITLEGADLAGFVSAAPDDHVKLFFPVADGSLNPPVFTPDGPVYPEGVEPSPSRDYTPRRYHEAAGELDIDFVLHGEGPASSWAEQAKPGDLLGVGGPRGSLIVASDFDTYVMVGDETALPAIGRWLETLPASAQAIVLAEIADAAERQTFTSAASVETMWIDRSGASASIEAVLHALPTPAGDTFWWVATESKRARALRQHLVEERGVDKDWVKATGYWKLDSSED